MTPTELLIYRIAAAGFVVLCLAAFRAAGVFPRSERKLARALLAFFALAVLVMALVACGGGGGGNDSSATPLLQPQSGPLATATPNGVGTPAATSAPRTLYCPKPEAGLTVFCVVVEPTPGPATVAVYETRWAEWAALGTPTTEADATAYAYATEVAVEIATAMAVQEE